MKFQSPEELERFLEAEGVNTAAWGQGKSKGVSDLYAEMVSGESILQEDPLLRIVPGVVRIVIRREDCVLTEIGQELRDGRVRSPEQLPSEKLKPREGPIDAARRCLNEELDVKPQDINELTFLGQTREETQESRSYPGLLTKYYFHVVEADVGDLPEGDFWTTESSKDHDDPVKRHHWAWRSPSDDAVKGSNDPPS